MTPLQLLLMLVCSSSLQEMLSGSNEARCCSSLLKREQDCNMHVFGYITRLLFDFMLKGVVFSFHF